jgi:hypothetical protein
MEVGGVSQPSAALFQESVASQRETQAAQGAPRQEPLQSAERVETRPVEALEQPKPVVNTQGQTTGTTISTTA